MYKKTIIMNSFFFHLLIEREENVNKCNLYFVCTYIPFCHSYVWIEGKKGSKMKVKSKEIYNEAKTGHSARAYLP